VLTTFTWSRVGQLFKVVDGRNHVGSGVVSADNNAPCDIQITDDPVLSSAHFLILCQGGKHIISDNFSTNGTFVNGVQIDTRGIDLPDNAVIKAGTTVFTFQRIHAAPGGATVEPVRESESGGWRPGGGEETLM
jgi:pSer/pThr/pTyr-binding forkhead associated (FHA) protein